jgi:glutathione S-transferase
VTLTLYHHRGSTCSQKVRICLAEKRVPWQGHVVELRAFEQLEPWFLALNPQAMVPVLQIGNAVLTESLVINEYLDDAFPDPPLRPADPLARARMREWTLHVATDTSWAIKVPSFMVNIRPDLRRRYDREQIERLVARMPNRETAARWVKAVTDGYTTEQIAQSFARLDATLDRMQATLQRCRWLAGDAYTLADVDMAPFVHRLAQIGEHARIAARPAVAAWYEAVSARAAFAEAMPS